MGKCEGPAIGQQEIGERVAAGALASLERSDPLTAGYDDPNPNIEKQGSLCTHVDTVIVGGGQAGLSVSYYLTKQARDHLVLEQSDKPAEAWRNHRWDSFTLNTPNWQTRLPGAEYKGVDPDGFMSRSDVVVYLENYVAKFHLPVRFGVRAERVERNETTGLYLIHTSDGRHLTAWNVVVATGLYQTPKVPQFSAALPSTIRQGHFDAYPNPPDILPRPQLGVGRAP